jgi:hypothetical protein
MGNMVDLGVLERGQDENMARLRRPESRFSVLLLLQRM